MLWLVCTIFGVIMLLVLLLLLVRFHFEIHFQNSHVVVRVGGRRVRFVVFDSANHKKEEQPAQKQVKPKMTFHAFCKKWQQWEGLFQQEKAEIKLILKKLARVIRMKKLSADIVFGFENAAATGMAYGFIWCGVGTAFAFLERYLSLSKVARVQLTPDFLNNHLETDVSLIFQMRLVSLIKPALRTRKLVKRVQLAVASFDDETVDAKCNNK